jgi:hypothetical protein
MVPRSNGLGVATYLKGGLFGLTAVSIWAGWSAVTRLAVTTKLDAWDIAALRFGIAGCLLAPIAVRRGFALDPLGWSGLALLIAGAGVPYVLLAAAGLQFAPAHDQGALNPGFMPLFVALITTLDLGEKLAATRQLGLALIVLGALIIVGVHAAAWNTWRLCGDALFLAAAPLWACFTVVMQQARLDPLQVAAVVSCGSALIYLPGFQRNTSGANCACRGRAAGDLPGLRRDGRVAGALRPSHRAHWSERRSLRRPRARALCAHRDTAPRRMARPLRLGWHWPHFLGRIPGEWWADLPAQSPPAPQFDT